MMSRSGDRRHSAAVWNRLAVVATFALVAGCSPGQGRADGASDLRFYVFDEPSGAFQAAAERCAADSGGRYSISIELLPNNADGQREQLARRLAARDQSIDLVGMDVIWTAEFAEAGWILPFEGEQRQQAEEGRLTAPVQSATYDDRLWGVPLTSNAQLLWYRSGLVDEPPATWEELLSTAESLGPDGTIQAQGDRYEGLTVFFTTLLASAGGSILTGERAEDQQVSLDEGPTKAALTVMRDLARSPATERALSTTKEDEGRLAFEQGGSAFMVNWPFVWASANENAPDMAADMGWSTYPEVVPGRPARVTVGGLNIGVGAFSPSPELAREAALCVADERTQIQAATEGGLPPTIEDLYGDPRVRDTYPFADELLATLRSGVQRPQSPAYADVSLAIARTLHPMSEIDPDTTYRALRDNVGRALRGEGLL
jgi:multiple sugar transport system substrate-binding protein